MGACHRDLLDRGRFAYRKWLITRTWQANRILSSVSVWLQQALQKDLLLLDSLMALQGSPSGHTHSSSFLSDRLCDVWGGVLGFGLVSKETFPTPAGVQKYFLIHQNVRCFFFVFLKNIIHWIKTRFYFLHCFKISTVVIIYGKSLSTEINRKTQKKF